MTTGWAGGVRVDMPGLGRRRVAPVETFDAEYLGPLLSVQSRVSFCAGLESRIEQIGVELLAGLRKRRWVGSLTPLIPLLLRLRKATRLSTSSSGGMSVDIRGLDPDGVAKRTRWSLVAKRDHGPFIPMLPAAAALRRLLADDAPRGAYLAERAVSLADILKEMRPYAITTETSESKSGQSVFEQALGSIPKSGAAGRRAHPFQS